MMKTDVKWLVEPQVFEGDATSLLDGLERLGVPHEVCTFGRPYESYLDAFSDDECVVFYGSLQFARLIQRNARWIPGVYCNLPQFQCTYYYPRFGEHLLNSDYFILPYGDFIRQNKYGRMGVASATRGMFIRPSSGFKTFTGCLFEEEKIINELNCVCEPETLVVVAPPAKIVREWRTIVAEGEIIASSQYKEGDKFIRKEGSPESVIEYGNKVLDSVEYSPDFVWSLDICEKKSGELKVLEVGSFSCVGLYACDVDPIIQKVNYLAAKEYEDYQ